MARLIDASVFIELERRGRRLSAITAGADGELHALASITAAELLYGVERADTSDRRRRRSDLVESVLQTVPVVPHDVQIARVQAQLWRSWKRPDDASARTTWSWPRLHSTTGSMSSRSMSASSSGRQDSASCVLTGRGGPFRSIQPIPARLPRRADSTGLGAAARRDRAA